MRQTIILALLFSLAVSARAEEYVNKTLKMKISVPDTYEIRGEETAGKGVWYAGWNDVLVEIKSKDGEVGGMILYSKTDWSAKKCADWREEQLQKDWKTCDRTLDKKLKRSGDAAWMRSEYTLTSNDGEFHHVHVFCTTGTAAFEAVLWCSEKLWETYQPQIDKIYDSFVQGEDAVSGAGAGGTDPGSGAAAGPVTKAKTPEHMWKGFGEGTSVKYAMVSEASGTKTEMSMIYVLVKQGDNAYTVKTTTEIPAYKMKTDATTEYEIEAAKGENKDAPKTETGNEKISVPAGEFDCQWVKTYLEQGWSKVWLSDKVPGRIVKSESEMAGSKSKMELIELTKK